MKSTIQIVERSESGTQRPSYALRGILHRDPQSVRYTRRIQSNIWIWPRAPKSPGSCLCTSWPIQYQQTSILKLGRRGAPHKDAPKSHPSAASQRRTAQTGATRTRRWSSAVTTPRSSRSSSDSLSPGAARGPSASSISPCARSPSTHRWHRARSARCSLHL